MDRYFFIVNPVAGNGRTTANFEKVRERLDALHINYGVAYTQRPGDATPLAREALAAGEKCIVSVGGDGTMNEVACALCDSQAVMGILPFGTGNDMARVIPLPTEPLEALNVLLEGNVRKLDAGTANGRFFLNVMGMGFDVDVLVATEKYKKTFNKGMLPYLLGIFDALTHLRSLHIKVESPEASFEQESVIVCVGNGQYFGGGMRAVPTADPYDGLFDVYVIEKVGVFTFLRLLTRFIKGKHADLSIVHKFRTAELTLSCPEKCMLELDGEVLSGPPVALRLLPGCLNILCSKG